MNTRNTTGLCVFLFASWNEKVKFVLRKILQATSSVQELRLKKGLVGNSSPAPSADFFYFSFSSWISPITRKSAATVCVFDVPLIKVRRAWPAVPIYKSKPANHTVVPTRLEFLFTRWSCQTGSHWNSGDKEQVRSFVSATFRTQIIWKTTVSLHGRRWCWRTRPQGLGSTSPSIKTGNKLEICGVQPGLLSTKQMVCWVLSTVAELLHCIASG